MAKAQEQKSYKAAKIVMHIKGGKDI